MTALPEPVRLPLDPALFGPAEREIARYAGMTARAFRYPSGVAALRIAGRAGEIVVLPFQGQQIWDATSGSRRLTMQTRFDQPIPTRDYLATYGAFMIHCGAAAMGNPGPQDDHPLHGELPNAPFEDAALLVGDDADGPFMALAGCHSERRAFHHDYSASPAVTLHRDHFRLDMTMRIVNARHVPLPVLYLLHLNFRPVPGARLVDTVPDDGLRLRDTLPEGLTAPPSLARLLDEERAAPGRHRALAGDEVIDPELVLTLSPRSCPDGWAHAMQRLPDGSADFVSYRPESLPHAARWIVRSPEMQALGLLLPATAAPDGRAAARAAGQGHMLAPGAAYSFSVRFGTLPAPEAARLEALCDRARSPSLPRTNPDSEPRQ